ncbi:MAG: hypothetical protein ABIR30_11890 [Chitinophagaceae bacterium]
MKNFITTLLLVISVWNFSYGQPSVPGRINGCFDSRFVAAEQIAYEELVKTRAEIDRWREERITYFVKMAKESVSRENLRYLEHLKSCASDTGCSSGAKRSYDNKIIEFNKNHDNELKTVSIKAEKEYGTAQDEYDEAVKKAKELYPPMCFLASGQDGPTVYSGTVCDTRAPFELTGTNGPLIYPFKFTPTSDSTGTFSFITQYSSVVWKGSGTYIIKGLKTGKARMDTESTTTVTTPGGTSSGSGPGHINLDCKN